jgi:hypothetical protein
MTFRFIQAGLVHLARPACGPSGLVFAAMALLTGCVDLTPPWEGAAGGNVDTPVGSGGEFVQGDASGAGGASGDDGPAEGWPTSDTPLSGPGDDTSLGQEGGLPSSSDGAPWAWDASAADAVDGLAGAEASGANDVSLASTDSAGVDVQLDSFPEGTGGSGGSLSDASSGDVMGGGGIGGDGSASGGTGGFDAAEAGDTGDGGSGQGGSGAGGTTGTGGAGSGGSGAGGSGTGGDGTGGSGSGGSGTGGAGGISCAGYVGPDAGSPNDGLVAWYRCESAAGASGSMLPDSSGHANDGTLHTGAGGAAGYTFNAGKLTGNALYLVAAQKGYVTLPVGLLANACEVTIATWVLVNSSQTWQRIFDFGRQEPNPATPNVYMFLTPKNGGNDKLRFAITIGGKDTEQIMDGPAELPAGSWHHVAVVLDSGGGSLYVDGAKVGSNTGITLRPADLGNPPDLFIGRSLWAVDPYFDGDIDSFRIYDRALSADEISALYNGT